MDVMRLIDHLESLATSGTRVPMMSRVIIDEQEFLDLVDQIRVAYPEELRQARKLSQDRERLLNQAQVEADKILVSARDQVASLVSTNDVVVAANQEAEEILASARAHAEEIQNEADAYAIDVLARLEGELQRIIAQARKGRALLERNGQEVSAGPAVAGSGVDRSMEAEEGTHGNGGRPVRRGRE
jgi:vacuolar-type H+-ATPase subunit H